MANEERIQAIQAELQRRGVPGGEAPRSRFDIGRGVRAGLRAFPSIALEVTEPTFFEKERFKHELKQETPLEREQEIEFATEKARRVEAAKAEEKGLPAETAGKAAMLQQALSDLEGAEKLLFTKEGKFLRGRAAGANIPGGSLPGVPSVGFGPVNRELASKIDNALEAKLRIETGAAATQEEFERLKSRFGITIFDSGKSAKDKIKRLKEFMRSGIIKIDPSGRFRTIEGGRELGVSPGGVEYEILPGE